MMRGLCWIERCCKLIFFFDVSLVSWIFTHISFIHEGGELFEEIREMFVCLFFKKLLTT